MNQPIRASSQSVSRVATAVQASPGMKTEQVAEAAGYSASHTQNVLAVATKAGLVKAMHIKSRIYGWFPAELVKKMLSERAANAAAELLRKASKPAPDRQIIREMAAGPDGATSAAIKALGIKHNSARRHIVALIERGHVFRSHRAGCRLRWFDSQARADSWAGQPAMIPSEWEQPGKKAWQDHPARQRRMADIGERLTSSARQPSKAPQILKGSTRNQPGAALVVQQKPGKDAPVSIKARKDSPPDYSKATLTVAKKPEFSCRWQQIPDSGQSIFADRPSYGSGAAGL